LPNFSGDVVIGGWTLVGVWLAQATNSSFTSGASLVTTATTSLSMTAMVENALISSGAAPQTTEFYLCEILNSLSVVYVQEMCDGSKARIFLGISVDGK